MNGFWLILIVFGFIILLIKGFEGELVKIWNLGMKFFNTYHQFLTFAIFTPVNIMMPSPNKNWYRKKIQEFNALK